MLQHKIKVYMCGTNYQHELREAADGVKIYPSAEDLRKHCKCHEECGIVEMDISFIQWVQPQQWEWAKK